MVAMAPPCRVCLLLQRDGLTVRMAVTVGVGEEEAELKWREERRIGVL